MTELDYQERHEDRHQLFHESDSFDHGDQEARSISSTTVDAGQSRVLTAFSNLMHHQKDGSSLRHQMIGERLMSGSTFEVLFSCVCKERNVVAEAGRGLHV